MKKILALVLALTMALSVGAFAGFSDVPSTDANNATYELLSNLKIIGGYEDGTFKAGNVVTRAEAAAFIYRMSEGKYDANELKGPVVYAGKAVVDCDTNAWYTGYINWAINKGIMAGDPAGTFRPNATVSVAEMSKMLVVALGYSANNFTFPYGFMSQARTLGLLKGVDTAAANTPCLRSMVAVMSQNTLSATRISYIKDPNGNYQSQAVNSFLVDVFNAKTDATVYTVVGTSDFNAQSAKEGYVFLQDGANPVVGVKYAGDASSFIGRQVKATFKQSSTALTIAADDVAYSFAAAVKDGVYTLKAADLTVATADLTFKAGKTASGADIVVTLTGAAASVTGAGTKIDTTVKVVLNSVPSASVTYAAANYNLVVTSKNVAKVATVPTTGLITFTNITGTTTTPAAKELIKAYDGIKKDDIVVTSNVTRVYKDQYGVLATGSVLVVEKANIVSDVVYTGTTAAGAYTIGGVNYNLYNALTIAGLNDGAQMGNKVNLVLSPNGYIAALTVTSSTTTSVYGVVVNVGGTKASYGTGALNRTITVMTADGKETTYPIADTTTFATYLTAAKTYWNDVGINTIPDILETNQIFKLTINAAGEAADAAVVAAGNATLDYVKTTGIATDGVPAKFTVDANTVVFQIRGTVAANDRKITVIKGTDIPAFTGLTITSRDANITGTRNIKFLATTDEVTPSVTTITNATGYVQYLGQKLVGSTVKFAYKVVANGIETESYAAARVQTDSTSHTEITGTPVYVADVTVNSSNVVAVADVTAAANPAATAANVKAVDALTGSVLTIKALVSTDPSVLYTLSSSVKITKVTTSVTPVVNSPVDVTKFTAVTKGTTADLTADAVVTLVMDGVITTQVNSIIVYVK